MQPLLSIFAAMSLVLALAVPASAQSRAQQRATFLRTVDESISGGKIAGNPFRYVGKHVDLHCTVLSIPDPSAFNADCGGDNGPLVIITGTSGLSTGQAVRIQGTVLKPVEGTNMMGGVMQFPAVQALFMQ